VLVYEDRIIGEGYHELYGGPHAEVNCIRQVAEVDKPLIKKSTLYVSLEPCNHTGKTPPCSELIITHQIPRVVVACTDPFEKVNGSGIARLREAGIEVVTGKLEKEAIQLNRRFFTFHQQHRPYIILKWAQSLDGFIAAEGYKPVAISHSISNRLVHKWRSEEAAIMVGNQTAISDNPKLNNRLWPGKSPVRIVIDKALQLPAAANLLDDSIPTIILNTKKDEIIGHKIFHRYKVGDDLVKIVCDLLFQMNLSSLIVEGGARLLQSFIDKETWDEARVIVNNDMLLQKGIAAPVLHHAQLSQKESYRSDDLYYYLPHKKD
jgi:diaminohydroxyphosphoribosylaminopyrimidine deaminase/5-amino-6-(5-phosphoribosylamino)uracil reductase